MKSKIPVIVFTILFLFTIIAMAFAFMPRQSVQSPGSQMQPQTKPKAQTQAQISNLSDPHVVIKKRARTLELFDGEKLVKKYKMALGFTPNGDKEMAGDGKTPEGEFYVFVKNDQSKFYLSLGVSYPNVEDAKLGFEKKLISRAQRDQILDAIARKKMPLQNTKLGGAIYIHGGGIGRDWTWGCIAMEDADIKEIYDSSTIGTRITILP